MNVTWPSKHGCPTHKDGQALSLDARPVRHHWHRPLYGHAWGWGVVLSVSGLILCVICVVPFAASQTAKAYRQAWPVKHWGRTVEDGGREWNGEGLRYDERSVSDNSSSNGSPGIRARKKRRAKRSRRRKKRTDGGGVVGARTGDEKTVQRKGERRRGRDGSLDSDDNGRELLRMDLTDMSDSRSDADSQSSDHNSRWHGDARLRYCSSMYA